MDGTLLISLATNIQSSLWSLWTIQKTHEFLNVTMLLMGFLFYFPYQRSINLHDI